MAPYQRKHKPFLARVFDFNVSADGRYTSTIDEFLEDYVPGLASDIDVFLAFEPMVLLCCHRFLCISGQPSGSLWKNVRNC